MKQPNKWQRNRISHQEEALKKAGDFIMNPMSSILSRTHENQKCCPHCGKPLGCEWQMDFDDLNTGEKITFHSRCVPHTKYFEIAQQSGWTKEQLRHENEISKDIMN